MLADVEERRRLECRMQDGVERRLAELTARLGSFEADDSVSGHLERAVQQLTATCTDLRQLARGLHPRELSLGLVAAVEGLIARTPLPVELHVEVRHAPPDEIAAAAYFVCAEALSNVVKHADAQRARVDIAAAEVALVVVIVDDGCGGADPTRGTGLRGLIDRVSSLDGSVIVSSRADSGTRLTATLPIGLEDR